MSDRTEKRSTNVLRFLNGKLQQQHVVETYSDDYTVLHPTKVEMIWEDVIEVFETRSG